MAIEIEKKFLVDKTKWEDYKTQNNITPRKEDIILQCYICTNKTVVTRVRIYNSKGFITIKSKTNSNSRHEFEYEIPIKDAQEMFQLFCEEGFVSKVRYKIKSNLGYIYEIDEYFGSNEGLVICEVELTDETKDDEVEFLPFMVREIINESKYSNKNLALKPYLTW